MWQFQLKEPNENIAKKPGTINRQEEKKEIGERQGSKKFRTFLNYFPSHLSFRGFLPLTEKGRWGRWWHFFFLSWDLFTFFAPFPLIKDERERFPFPLSSLSFFSLIELTPSISEFSSKIGKVLAQDLLTCVPTRLRFGIDSMEKLIDRTKYFSAL